MSTQRPPSEINPEGISLRPLVIAITDIIGAALLVLWGLLLGPLGVLRGTLSFANVFWYIWILSPLGLLSRLVKAAIDWRLGNFDAAVFQMEFLCSRVERYLTLHPRYRHPHIVLEDFYTLLVRAYLHGGHIDDAMMVILRAKKQLGMDRLPALARLDAKTAHLVRAGLAAGKLLDGGGLATLFVKSNSETPAGAATPPNQAKNRLSDPRRNHSAETPGSPVVRQGATAGQGATQRPPLKTGQIIMFPTRPKNTTLPMDPEVPKS